MKTCRKCGLELSISSFYKDKRGKDGTYSVCKKCHKIYNSKSYNKEAHTKYVREWNAKNREKHRAYKNAYTIKRKKRDPAFHLGELLRIRLNCVLKGRNKNGSAVRDLGCSQEELKQHIEKQFTDGMSWDNHSNNGWHLDHITPLSSFDLTDREQLLKAVHYTNLQPLWAKENLSKGSKILTKNI